MIFENLYMIRNGQMGTNYETKFIFTVVTIFLCLYDWRKNKRLDYFWVFIVGTIIWTIIEFRLQLSGTRDIIQAYLFGLEIPTLAESLLRGTYEGSIPAVLGVFFADRIIEKETRKRYIIISITCLTLFLIQRLLQAKPTKDIGGEVASRRVMFTPFGIIFLTGILIINILWLWKRANKEQRKRAIYMFMVMLAITVVFTIGEYIANTRWVEIGNVPDNLHQASPLIEFAALNYNNFIEFASMYIPFLIIPYELKLIKIERDSQLEE